MPQPEADTNSTDQSKAKAIWDQLDREESGQPVLEGNADTSQIDAPQGGEGEAAANAASPNVQADAQKSVEEPLTAKEREELALLRTQVTQLSGRMRNVEGSFGGLKSSLETRLQTLTQQAKAAGVDAPQQEQIDAAKTSTAAMAKLKEEYPDFGTHLDAVFQEERARVLAAMPKTDPAAEQIPEAGKTPAQLAEEFDQYRRETAIELSHRGWKQTVQSKEFQGWMAAQGREVQNLAGSRDPEDAIRLLDLHRAAAAEPQNKTQDRLRAGAALPTGRASASKTKSLDEMTPKELWSYYDSIEKKAA